MDEPVDIIDWALLEAYFSNSCSAEQRAAFDAWLAGSPERAELEKRLRAFWLARAERRDMSKAAAYDWDRAGAIAHVMQYTRAPHSRASSASPAKLRGPGVSMWPRAGSWGRSAGIAALACALVVVGLVAYRGESTNSSHRRAQFVAGRSYRTSSGQRATVTLSDGSKVTLGPQSTLDIDAHFGSDNRAIALSGEAHFDVRSAAGAPFEVRTGSVTTQVLGTTFGVRRYSEDRQATVSVSSGKVAVSATAHPERRVVIGRQMVAVVGDSGSAVTSSDSAAQWTMWDTDQLHFYRAEMSDVLVTLGRWYGYQFRLADPSLAKQRVTAVLDTQSSAQALGTIKLLLNVDLTFENGVVTLHPRHAQRSPSKRRPGARDDLATPSSEVGK